MTALSDNFNRANAQLALNGWVELGAGSHTVTSNQCAPSATTTALTVFDTACATDNNFSKVVVATAAGTSMAVVCRADRAFSNNNFYRFFYNGTQVQLSKSVAGTVTSIGSAFVVTLSANDTLTVRCTGSTIEGLVNDVVRCTTTDTDVSTGKYVGLRSAGNTSVRYDDWTGGDFAAAIAPGAPTSLTLGAATATTQPLSWTAPASDGGSAITDYIVQWSPAGAGSWTTFADGTSTTPSTTVTGLTASTSYDYRVAAVNAVGTGANSSTATGSTAAAGSTSTRTGTIQGELNRLAGTQGRAETAAANIWAGTTGRTLVGALNAKAGVSGQPLQKVCNTLAGTSGLAPPEALARCT